MAFTNIHAYNFPCCFKNKCNHRYLNISLLSGFCYNFVGLQIQKCIGLIDIKGVLLFFYCRTNRFHCHRIHTKFFSVIRPLFQPLENQFSWHIKFSFKNCKIIFATYYSRPDENRLKTEQKLIQTILKTDPTLKSLLFGLDYFEHGLSYSKKRTLFA